MANYVYKLKSKFVKHPELLQDYGFFLYEDNDGVERVYAKGIKLSEDCSVIKYIIKRFENAYKNSDNKEEFSEYSFYKNGKLRRTKKVIEELTKCQLCAFTYGENKSSLFINSPDSIEYFNSKVLEECCSKIIERLLEEKVIYKKKIKNEK